MNEKLQYATMLEIPVNTCSVTYQPQKKRRAKKKKIDHDGVKQELLNKVNTQMVIEDNAQQNATYQNQSSRSEEVAENVQNFGVDESFQKPTANIVRKEKQKPKGKFSVIGLQMVIIGLLVATIFLTNAIYTDSGINVFLREVFGTQTTQQVDTRSYDEFVPVISLDDGASAVVSEGVITVSGKGSVYAPCDGKVTNVTQGEDGKYTVEITHSQNFKSLLGGLDYAYAGLNDSVYYNIPVGYCKAEVTMCFTGSDGAVISDYQIIDNSVVWAV